MYWHEDRVQLEYYFSQEGVGVSARQRTLAKRRDGVGDGTTGEDRGRCQVLQGAINAFSYVVLRVNTPKPRNDSTIYVYIISVPRCVCVDGSRTLGYATSSPAIFTAFP